VNRRAFLLAPVALYAQSASGPRLSIQWISGSIPSEFARQAAVFSRAYTCCPNRDQAQWALEHGRFPHAARAEDPSLWDYFERADPDTADVIVITAHSADAKDSWREHSVHVPMAIRWPGKIAPRMANELCSHADVFPSLLALAGIAAPEGLHGRDLRGAVPDSIYIEGGLDTRDEWRALVRGFDKLIWNFNDEVLGLYHVMDDPNEQHDLRDEREGRLMRDSLWALAKQWMDRVEDGRDEHGLRTRRPA
jgi:hypothetical protein